ncbi:MAG: O-antigen ligase family protein [Planctomycetes bacterium]|nr:O-antigen ligase family protein [Planctomycetota bacterium]
MRSRRRSAGVPSRSTRVLGLLLAASLAGDYLLPSLSRALVGRPGNWLLLLGLLQLGAIALAAASGALRGLRPGLPGVGLVLLVGTVGVHVLHAAAGGPALSAYGQTKALGVLGLALPAFLVGALLGRGPVPAGRHWIAGFTLLLLGMTVTAWAIDPSWLTLQDEIQGPLLAGVLVLPVHQALAFGLGKAALWWHATAAESATRLLPRILPLGVTGACLGFALLSGSRGYVIAAGLGVLAQAVSVRRPAALCGLLGLGAVLWWFGTGLASDAVRDGLDPQRIATSTSWRERGDLFDAAANAFLGRPFTGYGPGGFATLLGESTRVYPHNVVLEVASELGLPGLLALGLLLLPPFARMLHLLGSGSAPTHAQRFAGGFLVFAVVASCGIGDLLRNAFLFTAAGMAATAFRPVVRSCHSSQLAADPVGCGG